MKMFLKSWAAAFLLLVGIVMSSGTVADDKVVNVKFPRGASGTTLTDVVRGYDGVSYRIGVQAGQRMSLQLDTNNTSNYFNVTGPGASAAMFNGSMDGNSTTFVVPSSGTWVVNVYLMRNAARRGETAQFSLTVYVEAGSASVMPQPVQPDFADGNSGGPDYWQVTGLSSNDTLNIRVAASTSSAVIGTLRNGDVVRNLGCAMNGSTRWCQIDAGRNRWGWVAGRYLHESFGNAQTLPAAPARPIDVPSVDRVDVAMMSRYCTGEASQRLGMRPQYLTTQPAFQGPKKNWIVYGSYQGTDGSKVFSCSFTPAGQFQAFFGG
jgi:hypothetical protein